MLTLDQVRVMLKDRKLKLVAQGSGLAYGTVRRIAAGDDKSVSYDVVKRLSDYLEGKNQEVLK
jgi:DNA-binding Xre family transcriptional regulator